jgi:hypothetical protein
MIYETHDYEQDPEGCFPHPTSGSVRTWTLASLWVNDTGLVQYLEQTYPGMPVYYSPIQASVQPNGQLLDHQWTWGLGAQNQSTIHIMDDQLPPDPLSSVDRIFWYSQAGVSFMDLDQAFQDPFKSSRAAYGTQYTPMLWGYIASNFASYGSWEPAVTMTGKITAFSDHACKDALP